MFGAHGLPTPKQEPELRAREGEVFEKVIESMEAALSRVQQATSKREEDEERGKRTTTNRKEEQGKHACMECTVENLLFVSCEPPCVALVGLDWVRLLGAVPTSSSRRSCNNFGGQ